MTSSTNLITLDHHIRPLLAGAIVHTWRVSNPRAIIVLQHGFGEYSERYVGYVDQHNVVIRHFIKHNYEVRALQY